MEITLSQLETFLAVCRTRTFTAAAWNLGVTQPAISARIGNLERELGVTLFDRRGSRVNLTPEGLLVQRHAEAGLAALNGMRSQLRDLDPLSGYLRVGSSSTFAATCLPRLVGEVERRFPKLRLEFTVSASTDLSRRLSDGSLDLAFLADPTVTTEAIVRPLAEIPVHWFSAADSPLAGRSLRPDDLADTTIIVNPPPSASYERVVTWFRAAGLLPRSIGTCDSLSTTIDLVRAGVGISVMPLWMANERLRAGEIIALKTSPGFGPTHLYATYMPSAPTGPVEALIELSLPIVSAAKSLLETW